MYVLLCQVVPQCPFLWGLKTGIVLKYVINTFKLLSEVMTNRIGISQIATL